MRQSGNKVSDFKTGELNFCSAILDQQTLPGFVFTNHSPDFFSFPKFSNLNVTQLLIG